MKTTLSLIVVTKNEAHDIADCLLSVRDIADEMIVFDSGSTDGTPDICRKLGATVIETDWPGFGPQKNRALDRATGDWVLSLDADERLDGDAVAHIRKILREDTRHAAFRIWRRHCFLGRFMNRFTWKRDYVVRLFRKSAGRFTPAPVHESVEYSGSLGTLRGSMARYVTRDPGESFAKMNAYSTAGARALYEKGRHTSYAEAFLRGAWAFVRIYVLHLGFFDGREGFLFAVLNAEGTYYKYLKLLELRYADTLRTGKGASDDSPAGR